MHLTIRRRLFLSNLAAVCLAAVVALIGYRAMVSLEAAMNAITANGSAMKHQLEGDMAHDALRADVLAAIIAGPGDPKAQEDIRRDHAQHAAVLTELGKVLANDHPDAALRSAIPGTLADIDAYLKSVARMIDLAFTDPVAARAALEDFAQHFHKLETSMATLSDAIEANSEATRVGGSALVDRTEHLLALAAVVAVILMVVVGQLTARAIRRPLDEALAFAGRIADGDLAATLDCSADDQTETGRLKVALQAMRANLHGVVSQVRGSTDAIATASGEIASGNLDLSRRTEQQAGALEETAASIEELVATVRQNADNAIQANTLSASASEVAVKGGVAVARVIDTMGAIDTSSRRIVDITGTIESIAFQTNILALNAAVEAARAGEQGRGFAVVASEVRNLAQRANKAAGEIKTLIDESVRHTQSGISLVAAAGSTMDEIVASVRRVTEIMGEIAAASDRQGLGIAQVNSAIGEIDAVTQQNAALVEQAAAAAASMQEQTANLSVLVGNFKLGEIASLSLAPAGRRQQAATLRLA